MNIDRGVSVGLHLVASVRHRSRLLTCACAYHWVRNGHRTTGLWSCWPQKRLLERNSWQVLRRVPGPVPETRWVVGGVLAAVPAPTQQALFQNNLTQCHGLQNKKVSNCVGRSPNQCYQCRVTAMLATKSCIQSNEAYHECDIALLWEEFLERKGGHSQGPDLLRGAGC